MSASARALPLGDVAEAGRLAEQGLARWPASVGLITVRARGLLAGGDVEGAVAAVGAVAASADAVPLATLRGEIAIARGDLDDATKLLDQALAKRPDDLDALVARAEVDLLRSDPHAAQTRLEARYSKQAPPRLTIAYASALRLQKQWQDARVALGRITTDGAPGPITGRAWLERARVERDAGNAKDARDAYGRAQEMLPSSREAQREAIGALMNMLDTSTPRARLSFQESLRRLIDCFSALDEARFPVICAVQGGCIGGALDLATACDIRVCSADAFFTVQEIHIGMMADLGVLQRLAKIVPPGVARQMAYTGERVDAKRALEVGLVNAVLPDAGALLDHAMSLARQIAMGQDLVQALGLANLELRQGDILDLDPSLGPFDYIIAHGVYSWVPDPVRDHLLRLASRLLSLIHISEPTRPY